MQHLRLTITIDMTTDAPTISTAAAVEEALSIVTDDMLDRWIDGEEQVAPVLVGGQPAGEVRLWRCLVGDGE